MHFKTSGFRIIALEIDCLLKTAGHVSPNILQKLLRHYGHCHTDALLELFDGSS